uniref:Uncharacterized protein n=1 Tax=Ditylenchus dipsaci TaxID=166011 RepID=A0A915DG22_9BILA
MDPQTQRHVHFPSPLFSSRRLSTPLSTPSTPLLLSPSFESPTFRPLHPDDIGQVNIFYKILFALFKQQSEKIPESRLFSHTNIYPTSALQHQTLTNPTAKSHPRGLASRILQAVLPTITNPLPHSRSYQDGMGQKEGSKQPRHKVEIGWPLPLPPPALLNLKRLIIAQKGFHIQWFSTDESVQIRRMSLKEFSGLDHPELSTSSTDGSRSDLTATNINQNVGSPLLARLHNASPSRNVGNLLDKFSNRRRSSAGLNKLSTWNSFAAGSGSGDPTSARSGLPGESLYDSFDIAIEGINMAINEASRNCANGSRSNSLSNNSPDEQKPQLIGHKMFEQAYKKLEAGGQSEKLEVLNETRLLVGACKSMVRSTSQPIDDKELFPLIQTTVHCADKVTQAVEAALRKRNSLFQAELLTAKTEQMLKALTETVRDLEKAYGTPKHGQEAKQLVRSSTTLAASLTQLIQAVQHL